MKFDGISLFELGMWKRSILVPLPPLPLPLPFSSSNTSSYPILQNGSGQSLPHPYFERGPAGACLVFLDFGDLSGDAVHVSTTLRGQLTTAVGVLLHQRHLLQRLQHSSGDRLRRSHKVAGGGTVSLSGAVDFGE